VTEIFAHRGCHVSVPENTVAAFVEARVVGADGVELDVRRTADGALVVSHDDGVAGVGSIAATTCRALPKSVPTLAEAMGACSDLRVNVEIKNTPGDPGYDPSGALAHQVVAALADLDWLGGVIISSFDLATCDAVRSVDAGVAVGWLIDWRSDPAPTPDVVAAHGLNAVHPFFHRVDDATVEHAHALGIKVNVWTVNDSVELARMYTLGVDTVITDDVALALATLAAHDAHG
jgi:glycerophosphoryl diester phosphodiesterase